MFQFEFGNYPNSTILAGLQLSGTSNYIDTGLNNMSLGSKGFLKKEANMYEY